ncbi:lytic transglycosylase domain-containing protein [Bartonella sp. DGB2]|uniref:lytic transglycosylase domain-containing protein n=1 Tax=Bartonella sp. DGB2 TaxID=3388426 RepID=UPI0039900239
MLRICFPWLFFHSALWLLPLSLSLASSAATPIPIARPALEQSKIPIPLARHVSPKPTPTPDHSQLKAGLAALNQQDANTAIFLRNQMPLTSFDRTILSWAISIKGGEAVKSEEILHTKNTLKNWPGQRIMERNFERALARESMELAQQMPSPTAILTYFSKSLPQTAQGRVAYARALMNAGQKTKAYQILAPWWHKAMLSTGESRYVLEQVGALLQQRDHYARMRHMLYTNQFEAAQQVADLAQATPLFMAFAGVAQNAPDAAQKLEKAKRWRNEPLFQFAQIQYLRRSGRYEEAAKLMLESLQNVALLDNPDSWWIERRVLSREILDINKPHLAYQLVIAHQAVSPPLAVDAEFHAGWYALRFLNKPKTALYHFSKIPHLSKLPISLSRGYYWMGRAAEALSDKSHALQYFKRAAHYGTTYYGQLAASKLARKTIEISYPRPSPHERTTFAARPPVRAIQILETIEANELAAVLYRELSTQLSSPGELALLAVMAEKNNNHFISLRIGKSAVARGLDVGALSHPLGAIPENAQLSSTGKALAYAIARQESEFKADARSRAGAVGLLQLLPSTAKVTAAKHAISWSPKKLDSDTSYNATLGAHFLGEQLQRFNGSYILTFIGYNAGPRRADEWIARYGDPRERDINTVVDWVERIPYTETRNYVMRVIENYEVYKARLAGQANIKTDLISGRRQ